MFGSDLFSSLFGGPSKADKVESDLLTRIRDLERVVATENESAVDRIIARHRRHYARKEDIEAFEKAWRKDLEWAYLRRIHQVEEEGEYKPDGKRSLAAARQGYLAALQESWEWARTHFAQARAYHGEHWSQSEKAVERIVTQLNVEPEVEPIDGKLADNIFKNFEIVDDERDKHLRESTKAKSPLEWMEAFYKVSYCSRALDGLITEELLEVAREGRWEEWISVSQKGGHSTTYEEVEKRQGDDKIVVVSPKGHGARDKTKLSKYIAAFKGDPHLESQGSRLWSIFWWACDFWPELRPGRKYTPTKKKDGKWHLIETYEKGLGAPSYKFEKVTGVYEKLPDGYETQEALRTAAWRKDIYG